jgi:hypothetical protein
MTIATTAVRLKATLQGVHPEVMRRIVVPAAIRLDRLHLTLQAAFGWTNTHLYSFNANGIAWGMPDAGFDFGETLADARKARLYDIVKETGAKTIHYLYDLSDHWDHVLKLERWFENTDPTGLPFLLEASGCRPPEDIGGPDGYAEFVTAISDDSHPRHAEFAERFPGFNPATLDKATLERQVDALALSWCSRLRRK